MPPTTKPTPLWNRPLPIVWPAAADCGAAFGLGCLVLILCLDAVFLGRVFYDRDVHLVWHEQVAVFFRSISSGSWPVWDPYTSFGQPLLANPNTQVFYPLTWLHMIVLPWTYYTLYVVLHLGFSAVGLYALGRRTGISRPGSFVAAAIWTASGPLLSLVDVWHHLGGAAWIPWALLSVDLALTTGSRLHVLLCGACLAMQILAGSPDMSAFCLLLVAALVLVRLRWRRPGDPSRRRIVASGLLALALCVGLSAAQWLPTLDVARRSMRWSPAAEAGTFWSVHPLQILQMPFPIFFDDLPRYSSDGARLMELWAPFIHSLYLGLPALALVAAALAARWRPLEKALVALLVSATLFGLGRHTPIHGLFVLLLPPIQSLRYPSKATILAALSWALLAGIGFDLWNRPPLSSRSWRLRVLVPLIALAVIGWAGVLVSHRGAVSWVLPTARGPLLLSAVLGTLAALLAVARGLRVDPAPWLAVAVAFVAVADLVVVHRHLNHTTDKAFYTSRPEILGTVQRSDPTRLYVWDYSMAVPGRTKPKHNRVPLFYEGLVGWPPALGPSMGMQAYLYPPAAGRWGLYGSYDPDLVGLSPWELYHMAVLVRAAEDTPAHLRLLQMGGVDYVVSLHTEGLEDFPRVAALPGLFRLPIHVFRVPNPLPRSYVVGSARIADGIGALKTLLDPAFDLTREVVLPQGPAQQGGAAQAGASHILELGLDRVRLEVDLREAGYVVLLDSYDPGWVASVDGRPAPVLRANVIFRAVPVPAGRHIVEQVYRPRALTWGLVGSAASLLVVAGAALGPLALRSAKGTSAARGGVDSW